MTLQSTGRVRPLTRYLCTTLMTLGLFLLSPLLAAQQPAEAAEQSAISTEAIRAVVDAHAGALADCYRLALAESPELKGTVRVQFTIEGDGIVVDPELVDGPGNATLEGCVVDAVASWSFPEPRNGRSVMVTYPFFFSTQPEDAESPDAESGSEPETSP